MTLTVAELLEFFKNQGACDPGIKWMSGQVAADPTITPEALWNLAIKMRRTSAELAYENERKREEPGWKPDSETHTGHAWCAWVAKRAGLRCATGTFSGRRKIADGPEADKLNVHDVLFALLPLVRPNPANVNE